MGARRAAITLATTAEPPQHDEHVVEWAARLISQTRVSARRSEQQRRLIAEARAARQARIAASKTPPQVGRAMEDATAERLRHAADSARVVRTTGAAEVVSADGVVEVREVPVKRREIRDTPFDRLIDRRILAKDDGLNRAYRLSGEELLKDTELAGLNVIRAVDPAAVGAARMNDGAFVRSDMQQAALHRVLKAKAVLSTTEAKVVDLVLIQRQNVTTTGHAIAPGRTEKVAAGIGVYVLQTALHALMTHYGFTPGQNSR